LIPTIPSDQRLLGFKNIILGSIPNGADTMYSLPGHQDGLGGGIPRSPVVVKSVKRRNIPLVENPYVTSAWAACFFSAIYLLLF